MDNDDTTIEIFASESEIINAKSTMRDIIDNMDEQLEAMKTIKHNTVEFYEAFLNVSGLTIDLYKMCPQEKLGLITKFVGLCYSKFDTEVDLTNQDINDELKAELVKVKKQLSDILNRF